MTQGHNTLQQQISKMSICLSVLQDSATVTSSIPSGHQSEGDIQQEELASFKLQFQQLCSDVNQLTADMKHMSITNTQVKHRHIYTQLN